MTGPSPVTRTHRPPIYTSLTLLRRCPEVPRDCERGAAGGLEGAEAAGGGVDAPDGAEETGVGAADP